MAGRRSAAVAAAVMLVGVSCFQVAPASAQGDVLLRLTGPDTVTADPGGRASVPVLIQVAAGAGAVFLEAEVPDGWRALVPSAGEPLPAGERTVRVVSVFVPQDAKGGRFVVRLRAADAVATVQVQVAEHERLEVTAEDHAGWIPAGSSYLARFRIANTGNIDAVVRLRFQSGGGQAVRADTAARVLAAGESFEVEAEVSTQASHAAFTHILQLRVAGERAVATASSRVEVLPQGRTRSPDPTAGVPAELRLRVSDGWQAGAPLRLTAAGPLRPGSGTRMELLLQGPVSGYSAFGERDVYRVALLAPAFTLRLGDDIYGISQLTDPGTEAFGIGGSAQLRGAEAGAYVRRGRRVASPDSQAAAYVRLPLGPSVTAGLNWIRGSAPDGVREVLGGQLALVLGDWFDLHGEYGRRPARNAEAQLLRLRVDHGPVAVRLLRSRADTAMAGGYGGAAVDAAHVAWRAGRQFTLTAGIDQHEREAQMVPTYSSSHRTVRVQLSHGSRLSVEARNTARSTMMTGRDDIERDVKAVRIRLGMLMAGARTYPFAEAGSVLQPGAVVADPFWKAGVHTGFGVGHGTFGAAVEYAEGADEYGRGSSRVATGSLHASLPMGQQTRLHFGAHGSRHAGTTLDYRTLNADGALEHRFPNGHTLAARVRSRFYSGVFARQETLGLLDYLLPIRLPTGAAASEAGMVTGWIRDAATGEPVARAVVTLGDRKAATDRRGRVAFHGVEPGRHYIGLDRSSVGTGRTAAQVLPLALDVEAGRTAVFELALLPAGSVSARVDLVRNITTQRVEGAALSVKEPLVGAVLEFVLDDQRIRRRTDARGTIELSDLRPGRWTITAFAADLPAFHHFEVESVVIDLLPGGSARVEFTVVPAERRLQILATAEVAERTAGAAPRSAPRGQPSQPAGGASTAEDLPAGWRTFRVEASMTTLREIARTVYQDAELWPKLWLANRASIADPAEVPVGLLLRVPPRAPLTAEERKLRDGHDTAGGE